MLPAALLHIRNVSVESRRHTKYKELTPLREDGLAGRGAGFATWLGVQLQDMWEEQCSPQALRDHRPARCGC
jgi:hypothetical protein